jgi:N-acetylneuraminate synthase
MFIAEAGINHNGSIGIAEKLIDIAKNAGADVIKFQKREVDVSVPESMKNKMRITPWGKISYLDYRKKIEFGKKEYDMIDTYCKSKKINWTASVWDIPSLEFIYSYSIPFIKIPSACITDINLLLRAKKLFNSIIISTGMSTLEEIKQAVKTLSGCELTILHCNSSYPASDNELDLNVIKTLKKMYPEFKIGYSGHENNIYACIAAKSLGAEVIERHVTIDRNMWGTDQKMSLTEPEMKQLINILNKIPTWLGKDVVHVYDSELLAKEKLRQY